MSAGNHEDLPRILSRTLSRSSPNSVGYVLQVESCIWLCKCNLVWRHEHSWYQLGGSTCCRPIGTGSMWGAQLREWWGPPGLQGGLGASLPGQMPDSACLYLCLSGQALPPMAAHTSPVHRLHIQCRCLLMLCLMPSAAVIKISHEHSCKLTPNPVF